MVIRTVFENRAASLGLSCPLFYLFPFFFTGLIDKKQLHGLFKLGVCAFPDMGKLVQAMAHKASVQPIKKLVCKQPWGFVQFLAIPLYGVGGMTGKPYPQLKGYKGVVPCFCQLLFSL